MIEIRNFIEWLSFHPSYDEIARALATEYLTEFKVTRVRFGRTNNDDSAVVLGQFGYDNADEWRNKVIPGKEWREFDLPEIDIIVGRNKDRWSPSSTLCVITLRDRGIMQGHVVFEFAQPIPDEHKHKAMDLIEDYCLPIALYLSFQNRPAHLENSFLQLNDSRELGAGQLSARQLSILRGMVEGKTNHELATEMGFSVSTIRHETMRIYQALSVSDRKEAAKKALLLSLI